MDCPLCGGELLKIDEYGYFFSHQSGKKLGNIYQCQTAILEEDECASEKFYVIGAFYDDEYGNLKEGYPV